MTDISKAWVVQSDSAVDPDSPLDSALATGWRDNLVHLREWLGASYTAGAVQDHNHDGVNSAAIDTGVLVKNGSFESGTTGWTLTPYTGGSITTNNANDMDGATALAITSTVLANGGGDALSSSYTALSGALRDLMFTLAVKASVANIASKAEVIWYDDAQAQISTSTIYSTTNTFTSASLYQGAVTPPANARFFKIKVTGGVPASGSAVGTVYFDGIQAFFIQVPGTSNFPIGGCVIGRPATYGVIDVGATVAGSSLYATNASAVYTSSGWSSGSNTTNVAVGSWRCISPCWGDGSSQGNAGLWIRYA